MCNLPFYTVQQLNKHQKDVHEDRRNKKCPYCQKIFRTLVMLKGHVNAIHEKTKTYHCDICSKTFFWRTSLIIHNRRFHPKTKISSTKSNVLTKNKDLWRVAFLLYPITAFEFNF